MWNWKRRIIRVPRFEKCFGIRRSGIETHGLGHASRFGQQPQRRDGSGTPANPACRQRLRIAAIGTITAIYPAVWGIAQLFTGKCRIGFVRRVCCTGVCSVGNCAAIAGLGRHLFQYILLSIVPRLWEPPLVYPTFRNSRGEYPPTGPSRKPWRIPALARHGLRDRSLILTGLIADQFGINASITVIGILTDFSPCDEYRMRCRTEAPRLTDWLLDRKKKS